jgi:hypothetical protein
MIAAIIALIVVQLSLPWFNDVSDKNISLPISNPMFWLACVGFTLFTGLLAGSYPALYLSSFNAVKVLKGTFKAGSVCCDTKTRFGCCAIYGFHYAYYRNNHCVSTNSIC